MCSILHPNSWSVIDDNNNTSNHNLHSSDSKNSFIDKFTKNSRTSLENMEQNKKIDGFLSFDEYFERKLAEYDRRNRKKIDENPFKDQPIGLIFCISFILSLAAFCLLCSYLSEVDTTALSQPVNIANFEANRTEYPMIFRKESTRKLLETPIMPPKRPTNFKRNLPKFLKPIRDLVRTYKRNFATHEFRKHFLLNIHTHGIILLILADICLFFLINELFKRRRNSDRCIDFLKQLRYDYQRMVDENKRRLFEELPFFNAELPDSSSNVKTTPLKIRRFPSNFHENQFIVRIRVLKRRLRKEIAVINNMSNISEIKKNEKIHYVCRKYLQRIKYTHQQYLLQLKRIKDILLKQQRTK